MTAEPMITCENLVKIYQIADLEVQALQGLDLTVAPGELLGVIGASGSGKSTLLNILGGLDRPTAGKVWVDGNDLLKMNNVALDHYRRKEVGFVWQQGTRNLIPYLTAQENVELPMTLSGHGGGKARNRAQELLRTVGLEERSHHYLTQLSGGEQQRVAIAIALINQPRLLLADEPTGEVDTATAQVIYETFRNLSREFGLTTIIVSHDQGIARYADRIVAVSDGKLATETIRLAANGDNPSESKEIFHEMVILDTVGRLQVPKEYLQHFNIKRRAQLELVKDGILILPVAQEEQVSAQEVSPDEGEAPRPAHGLRGWWQRRNRSTRGSRTQ